MSSIPANLSRVPNLLMSRIALSNVNRTNLGLYQVQSQMATGLAISRPSQDSVRAATILTLDDEIEQATQRLRNLQHAEASLNELDAAVGEVSDLLLEAKSIASNEVNLGSSADERAQQATIVGSLLTSMMRVSNRQSVAGYMFAGSGVGAPPVEEFLGGFRYTGKGSGIINDIGVGSPIRLSLGGDNAIGSVSSRHAGTETLTPPVTEDTLLTDLRGARGFGIDTGTVLFSFESGEDRAIDLSHADTVGDVADAIRAALIEYEQDNEVTILGSGGVSVGDAGIVIDVALDDDGFEQLLVFDDTDTGVTAEDLGLAGQNKVFTASDPDGLDLNPTLTWRSPVYEIDDLPLGQIRINNVGRTEVVDLSSATTFEDIKNIIEGANLGIRVEINATRDGLNVINEVAAGAEQAMSIEEIDGNDETATRLGIRTLTRDTRLSDFNEGRGVSFVTGAVDPETGLPAPSRDVDFVITLGDGRQIDIDLGPDDVVTVQTVISAMNSQAAAQGITVPDEFDAGLSTGRNGITLTQDPSLGPTITVTAANNSLAAEDLGLLDGTYNATTGAFRAEDRATVRVNNVLTRLIDLRDSLESDDTFGITLAGERLEEFVQSVAETRALVGGYTQRVTGEKQRVEDRDLVDRQIRSELRDVDFADASVRFSLLQTQLQAALQTTVMLRSSTLLDYLG